MTDPRLIRAEAIRSAILELLFTWRNPLQAADREHASLLYHPLVGPLYRLIAGGAGPLRLAVELAEAERRVGRTTPPQALVPVARLLNGLDVRL